MRVKFAGLTCSDLYVTVHGVWGEGPVARYGTIKVPLVALLHPEVTDAMDRAVRRKLAEAWSATPEDGELF